jgi:hypothetical protein
MKTAVFWDVKSRIFVDNSNDSEQPISPHSTLKKQTAGSS